MSCEVCHDRLDAYLDSELASNEMAKLESHLRGSAVCAADALGRMQVKRATQLAGKRYTPSPEFRRKVMAQIQARPLRPWAWMRVPQFAAAAAAIVLAVLLWNHNAQTRERQQALAQLADIHVATLASPNAVDVVSTDRHNVKPWFQGKLPFSFNLPELQGTPFTLAGGRVAYFEHAPAAQILFQYQQHRISVFIMQETPEIERELGNAGLVRQLSFNFEYWDSGGLCYVAVGDAEAANIGKLVTLLKQAGAKS